MLTEMAPADSPKIVTLEGSASKGFNILLHPLQPCYLIQDAVVP